jgi:hypothetical protein
MDGFDGVVDLLEGRTEQCSAFALFWLSARLCSYPGQRL